MKLKKILLMNVLLCLVMLVVNTASDCRNVSEIKGIAETKIKNIANRPEVVEAVKEANKEAVRSLSEIFSLDSKWKASEADDAWVRSFSNNDCAGFLRQIRNKNNSGKNAFGFSEMFVMDKQGNIVAETEKTSDYWQGDEDKFTRSFIGDKGEIFIANKFYDESSQLYLIQVSVPVTDPDTGKAIGVLMVGLLDE
ncbi:MAG: hypothetical protein HQL29_04025 [Candidatus Omnitrophica bacterium]|nr:hypothetical protein [Candidatus Omnitrophota bacterium]